MAAFEQSLIAAIETVWSTKPKLFTICYFNKKFAYCCSIPDPPISSLPILLSFLTEVHISNTLSIINPDDHSLYFQYLAWKRLLVDYSSFQGNINC